MHTCIYCPDQYFENAVGQGRFQINVQNQIRSFEKGPAEWKKNRFQFITRFRDKIKANGNVYENGLCHRS